MWPNALHLFQIVHMRRVLKHNPGIAYKNFLFTLLYYIPCPIFRSSIHFAAQHVCFYQFSWENDY
jgi:hypothetical protein